MESPLRKLSSRRRVGTRSAIGPVMKSTALAFLAAAPVLAQSSCISLQDSSACPAFSGAAISYTSADLKRDFPFLNFVSDRKSFDEQLSNYVRTTYVQTKFADLFGCGGIDFSDTSELYARYTRTVVCNSLVQRSITDCNISEDDSQPLCADTCAEFGQSEAYITSDSNLCQNPTDGLTDLIRADFINCSLPARSIIGGTCISGWENEPANCGYGDSTTGLCSYCSSGGLNSTDTCCYNANAEELCQDVKLPSITSTMDFQTPTSAPTSTNTAGSDGNTDGQNGGQDDGGSGLSGGAIAGIVIGVIAAVVLLALLLFCCLRRSRQRPGSQKGSIFNQPAPARKGPIMAQHTQSSAPHGYEVLPGGRIARMSALEGHSGDSHSHRHGASTSTAAAAAVGAGAGYMAGRSKGSSSDGFESPSSERRAGGMRGPPVARRRDGSLSSNSMLGSSVPQSPTSAGGFSSPQGVASQQSEQLPFFKDYYSSDDIHAGDRVAVLWAYQPRAADEFSLERGDMVKVVGIWDDGWATGVMLDERADEWEARKLAQRDSGVSNTSGRRDSAPATAGEIKAFPLVCVCLPEHWRKTIDGDGSTDN